MEKLKSKYVYVVVGIIKSEHNDYRIIGVYETENSANKAYTSAKQNEWINIIKQKIIP